MSGMFTLEDGQPPADSLIALRHALHREPELGLNLPLTRAKVRAALDGLPLRAATGLVGPQRAINTLRPMAASEDFAFVLGQVPGAYLGVGAMPPGVDPDLAAMNHSPRAVFDDGSVPICAVLLAELAARRLAEA
jgi:metal-dependent amidase/aminoacylase/carboxypeptidase family protein